MKQLEKALNSQLFIRTQKGVRLTAEGELLFPYVERGLSLIHILSVSKLECCQ